MGGGALRAGDFAPRQGLDKARARGHRRLGRPRIAGIDTGLAIERKLRRLRGRGDRNAGRGRKE
jgi:hypothetical protein